MRSTEKIRNVVLVGHNASGKTSLAEALLVGAGVIARQGTIEKGSTVMDHDPEERARRQSISLTVASFDWNDHRINLIDTPGYADFRGEALLGLAAADLAVFVDRRRRRSCNRRTSCCGAMPLRWASRGSSSSTNSTGNGRRSTARSRRSARCSARTPIRPSCPSVPNRASTASTDLLTHHAFVYDTGHAEPAEVPTELADAERRRTRAPRRGRDRTRRRAARAVPVGYRAVAGTTRTSAPRCGRPRPRFPRALRIGHRPDRRRPTRRLHLPRRPGTRRPRPDDRGGGRRHRRDRARSRRTTPGPRVQDDHRRLPRPDLDPEGPVRHDPRRRRPRQLALGREGAAAPSDLADGQFAVPRRCRRCRRHRRGDEAHRHPYR